MGQERRVTWCSSCSGEGWGLGRLHKGESLAEVQRFRKSHPGEGGGCNKYKEQRCERAGLVRKLKSCGAGT